MAHDPVHVPSPFSNLPEATAHDDEYCQTAGVRRNGNRFFKVQLTGKEFYSLLLTLEENAKKSTDYTEIRALVIWTEKIREQLRAQGW